MQESVGGDGVTIGLGSEATGWALGTTGAGMMNRAWHTGQ